MAETAPQTTYAGGGKKRGKQQRKFKKAGRTAKDYRVKSPMSY